MAKARLNVKLSRAKQKTLREKNKSVFLEKLLDRGYVKLVGGDDSRAIKHNAAKTILRSYPQQNIKGSLSDRIQKRLGYKGYYDSLGLSDKQYQSGASYIVPTAKGVKQFGQKFFLENLVGGNGQVLVRDGKSVLRLKSSTSFLKEGYEKLDAFFNKWERRKVSLARYREKRGRASRSQLVQFNQLRGRLSQRVSDALFKAGVHSQKELLDIIGRNVGWRNLTGNAYTGLVSMLVIRTNSSYNHKYIKSVAEHQGKRKRATRTMFSTNGKRGNYSHFHKGSRMPKRMWIGLRYDKPDSYFFIADKGQMHTTEKGGRYAYNEALDMLNEASNRLNSKEEKSERYITLRVVSGAEYIEHMNVKGGQGSIMDLAQKEAERLVEEKLKASLPDIVK